MSTATNRSGHANVGPLLASPPLARPHRNRRTNEKPPVRTPPLRARSHRNQSHRRTPVPHPVQMQTARGRGSHGRQRREENKLGVFVAMRSRLQTSFQKAQCASSHSFTRRSAPAVTLSRGAVRQQPLARFSHARFATGMRPHACPSSRPKASACFVSAAKHGSQRQPRGSQTLGAKASWRWPRESSSTCPQGYRCGWS